MRTHKILLIIYLLLATCFFVGLSILVKTTSYFPIDLTISRVIQKISFPYFSQAMTTLSNLGWGVQVNLTVALIVILLFILGRKLESLFVVFIAVLDFVLFFGIAKLINRPRPTPELIRVDWNISVGGYPSGHVLLYTMLFGFLIYLTYCNVRNTWIRAILIMIFSFIIMLIGLARIYSGQHWPTDILGGYVLGSICLIIIIYLYNWVKDLKVFAFLKRDHRHEENR